MNKTALIHAVWLVVAILSFITGFQWFPARSFHEPAPRMASKASLVVQMGRGNPSNAALNTLDNGKASPFSERDIKFLGETFRTSASPVERRLAFSQLLQGLTKDNALLVRGQIAHLDHHSPEFREFHYAWGAVGGLEAAMFGASTDEDDMSPALAGWASAKPSEALAWFKNLDIKNDSGFDPLLKDRKVEAEGLRNHLMHGLVQGLANADPRMASEFIGEVAAGPHDRSAHRMMHTVVEEVLRTDKPSKAVQWAESLPEGQARNLAMSRVADRYVDEDPQAAAAWAETYAHQPDNASVIGEVGHNWAAEDPQAAVAWVTELPEGLGKHTGMHRALHQWADNDPAAASEYLATMPDSGVKNAAISGFSRRLAWEDPQTAITWAETISSDEQRASTMIGVGQAWLRKDAEAAREWAASAGLPENVQQAILNPQRDQRR